MTDLTRELEACARLLGISEPPHFDPLSDVILALTQ